MESTTRTEKESLSAIARRWKRANVTGRFTLRIQTVDGYAVTRSVNYPDGTSPREVAAHQFAQFSDYAWITVTRDYANPFGRVPYSFPRNNC